MKTCSVCNTEFKLKRYNQNFCSRTCSNKSRKGSKYTGAKSGDRNYRVIKLRAYLIDTYGEFCAICGIGPEWNGSFLRLQVDHINGINNDDRPENTRLLCPNCHTQTDTWGNKKRGE